MYVDVLSFAAVISKIEEMIRKGEINLPMIEQVREYYRDKFQITLEFHSMDNFKKGFNKLATEYYGVPNGHRITPILISDHSLQFYEEDTEPETLDHSGEGNAYLRPHIQAEMAMIFWRRRKTRDISQ